MFLSSFYCLLFLSSTLLSILRMFGMKEKLITHAKEGILKMTKWKVTVSHKAFFCSALQFISRVCLFTLLELLHWWNSLPREIHSWVLQIQITTVCPCPCQQWFSHQTPRCGRESSAAPSSERQTALGFLHCNGRVWRCHFPLHTAGCCLGGWMSPVMKIQKWVQIKAGVTTAHL